MAVADVTSYPPVQPSFLHDVAADSMKPLASAVDTSALETSSKILDIIGRYRLNKGENIYASADQSVLKFIALIYTHVKAQQAVPLCLPAFPFKSPNSTSKVLGKLPDKAEEFALSHLNGMCQAIADIYPPGAKLTIISDGLVYNGVLSHCFTLHTKH
jgi:pyoverdine/dityrosine biosynthesis protein Dit1